MLQVLYEYGFEQDVKAQQKKPKFSMSFVDCIGVRVATGRTERPSVSSLRSVNTCVVLSKHASAFAFGLPWCGLAGSGVAR